MPTSTTESINYIKERNKAAAKKTRDKKNWEFNYLLGEVKRLRHVVALAHGEMKGSFEPVLPTRHQASDRPTAPKQNLPVFPAVALPGSDHLFLDHSSMGNGAGYDPLPLELDVGKYFDSDDEGSPSSGAVSEIENDFNARISELTGKIESLKDSEKSLELSIETLKEKEKELAAAEKEIEERQRIAILDVEKNERVKNNHEIQVQDLLVQTSILAEQAQKFISFEQYMSQRIQVREAELVAITSAIQSKNAILDKAKKSSAEVKLKIDNLSISLGEAKEEAAVATLSAYQAKHQYTTIQNEIDVKKSEIEKIQASEASIVQGIKEKETQLEQLNSSIQREKKALSVAKAETAKTVYSAKRKRVAEQSAFAAEQAAQERISNAEIEAKAETSRIQQALQVEQSKLTETQELVKSETLRMKELKAELEITQFIINEANVKAQTAEENALEAIKREKTAEANAAEAEKAEEERVRAIKAEGVSELLQVEQDLKKRKLKLEEIDKDINEKVKKVKELEQENLEVQEEVRSVKRKHEADQKKYKASEQAADKRVRDVTRDASQVESDLEAKRTELKKLNDLVGPKKLKIESMEKKLEGIALAIKEANVQAQKANADALEANKQKEVAADAKKAAKKNTSQASAKANVELSKIRQTIDAERLRLTEIQEVVVDANKRADIAKERETTVERRAASANIKAASQMAELGRDIKAKQLELKKINELIEATEKELEYNNSDIQEEARLAKRKSESEDKAFIARQVSYILTLEQKLEEKSLALKEKEARLATVEKMVELQKNIAENVVPAERAPKNVKHELLIIEEEAERAGVLHSLDSSEQIKISHNPKQMEEFYKTALTEHASSWNRLDARYQNYFLGKRVENDGEYFSAPENNLCMHFEIALSRKCFPAIKAFWDENKLDLPGKIREKNINYSCLVNVVEICLEQNAFDFINEYLNSMSGKADIQTLKIYLEAIKKSSHNEQLDRAISMIDARKVSLIRIDETIEIDSDDDTNQSRSTPQSVSPQESYVMVPLHHLLQQQYGGMMPLQYSQQPFGSVPMQFSQQSYVPMPLPFHPQQFMTLPMPMQLPQAGPIPGASTPLMASSSSRAAAEGMATFGMFTPRKNQGTTPNVEKTITRDPSKPGH